MRLALLVGPALILMSCAAALAQETAPMMQALPVAASTPAAMATPQEYLMTLGPFGALVWGAFILGRGVKLTINVKLDDDDRKLVERGVVALEKP
jgi:hypothetical protein